MNLARPASSSRKATSIDSLVGNRIRLRRTIIGVKQDELAHAVGISFQQLQKYECGQSRISASRLYDIARVLEAPLSWFLEPEFTKQFPLEGPGGVAATPANAERVAALPTKEGLVLNRDTLEVVRLLENLPNKKLRSMVMRVIRAMAFEANS